MTDPDHIANWQRLSPSLTTSGQPRAEEIAQLATLGVRHVINLGLASHPRALPDEAALVTTFGMRYTHIPVPFDEPAEHHYLQFRAALQTSASEPTHVHCIANYRVSAFFYRYHREVLAMPEPQARALMQQQWSPDQFDRPEGRLWAALIRMH